MNQEEFSKKRREWSQKSIDELLELLAAEDLQTRFFAEMRLRDATGV
ncbi:MAG: hypothetical protein ACR2N3_10510 [Pyrinomonadaceae bacterium]